MVVSPEAIAAGGGGGGGAIAGGTNPGSFEPSPSKRTYAGTHTALANRHTENPTAKRSFMDLILDSNRRIAREKRKEDFS